MEDHTHRVLILKQTEYHVKSIESIVNCSDYKQLLDEVFVISGIIKVEVSVISRSRRLRLITLTETLIIPDITKTESNNCFIIHCFEEKKRQTHYRSDHSLFSNT